MEKLNIVMLDTSTLGGDIKFSMFDRFGTVYEYEKTDEESVAERICEADVIIVNKIRLNETNLCNAKRLKLICVTATGYDNIDVKYCRRQGIAVCNVKGYSTESVAQVTLSMALSLVNNLSYFDRYVKDGRYTNSGTQNKVEPVFHEMNTMTWGVIGLGSIGKRVAELAESFGCRVLAYKRTDDPQYNCVPIDKLCAESDIISIHLPLNEGTREIINKERISKMKKNAIVINAARGAVVDERALTEAIRCGKLGGLGIDVYSYEPMSEDSPYCGITACDNVIFTPHMAWGAYEARVRCMEEIAENIDAFYKGIKRNRVEI